MSDPSVAIILLNWNAYHDTVDCLRSLENLNYRNFHVFVVDNDSKDQSWERLKADEISGVFNLPLTMIQSGKNMGCAGGNNIGFKAAYEKGYQYLWMLNNDTIADPDSLQKLVEEMQSDRQIGIVGSKIINMNNNLVWFAGGSINQYLGTSKPYGIDQHEQEKFNIKKEVDFVVGCSMLFRRELLEIIGWLEEDYFIYYEDTDWNLKVKKAGMKIIYVPDSLIYHKESSSTKSEELSPYYAYYLMRNGYLFVTRNNPKYKFIALMYMTYRIVKFHLLYVLRKDNKLKRSKMIFIGAWHGVTNQIGQFSE
ncbi:glycosyltransferase family 2 protein [Jeotgalibacillus sp. R-1-5s-1]|uniref:glycosyltransferase family 2 protein n=1 Tax=Jeotgalibacillus sp. R-1-5s-1 TaxID=2555897 RepID=UPI00106B8692|nr:glycosyltransferase family 2 protein [Jeotgalibacillus sp. R-1-5s-1]TFE00022.1 glycosyltransferase family 2 protein [Jeotgalibacillus sp. R-1-5s-1]